MNFDYLNINSKDHSSVNSDGSTPSSSNFEITMSQALSFNKIQLNCIQIPYTVYNVNTTNNTLVINWNSSNSTLTITPGSYTLSQLQSALNTVIQAINSNLSVSLNSQTWTYSFIFLAATPNTDSFVLSQSTINRLIGFPSSINTVVAGSLTSTSVALFMDQAFLFINLDLIGTNVLSSTSNNKYSFYVPINVNTGEMLFSKSRRRQQICC